MLNQSKPENEKVNQERKKSKTRKKYIKMAVEKMRKGKNLKEKSRDMEGGDGSNRRAQNCEIALLKVTNLKCNGFLSNLYEFFKFCSRKLWLFLQLTILRITIVMKRLITLHLKKISDTTMQACNFNYLTGRYAPNVFQHVYHQVYMYSVLYCLN